MARREMIQQGGKWFTSSQQRVWPARPDDAAGRRGWRLLAKPGPAHSSAAAKRRLVRARFTCSRGHCMGPALLHLIFPSSAGPHRSHDMMLHCFNQAKIKPSRANICLNAFSI